MLPLDFYGETSWRDDMMLGATELALALRSAGPVGACHAGLPVRSPARYLADAAHWARQWIGGKASGRDTLNLYDVSALADYELYRAIGGSPPAAGGHQGARCWRTCEASSGHATASRRAIRSASGSPGISGTPRRTVSGSR